MVRVEHRKYKYVYQEKYKIQLENNGNYHNHMRIDSVSTVRIHRQKHNMPPESRMCIG
jgi:hypothetical protein